VSFVETDPHPPVRRVFAVDRRCHGEEETKGLDTFAPTLAARLTPVLVECAVAVTTGLPDTEWHLEFPASTRYLFVGLLVFHPRDDRSTELAVVTVEVSESPRLRAMVDLTNRQPVLLGESEVELTK
jgi:hypothetical protein